MKAKAVVKPPKTLPRQPKLSRRRTPREVGHDIAPEQPVELGKILIPKGKEAEAALQKLAEMYDKSVQAHRAYVEQHEKASKAKKRWSDLRDEVLRELSVQTHESSLPILQAIEQQEADQAAMEDAATDGGEIGEAANTEPF